MHVSPRSYLDYSLAHLVTWTKLYYIEQVLLVGDIFLANSGLDIRTPGIELMLDVQRSIQMHHLTD